MYLRGMFSFGLNPHTYTSKSTRKQNTKRSVDMRVLGVMSHKAARAIETMMAGWVGRHLLNTKDNYKDKHSRKHSHPYQHRPNLGLLMANLILV